MVDSYERKYGTISGKRIDTGRWVKGYYCYVRAENSSHAPAIVVVNGDKLDVLLVYPETVGECSNVPDFNGRQVFEGDVLESRASLNTADWKRWVVVFEDGCYMFIREYGKRTKLYERNVLCRDEVDLYGLEVIGNIHDNPRLTEIEGGEKNKNYRLR